MLGPDIGNHSLELAAEPDVEEEGAPGEARGLGANMTVVLEGIVDV